MERTSRCTLGSQAQHKHSLEDLTWSIQQITSTHTQHLDNIQQQNNNHTHKYCELFPQTIHKHCKTRNTKLLQTKIPGTIIKFIVNYIKGRKAYTTYKNHTSIQRQFKTGVPQGIVLSSTLLNIYTVDLPPPRALVQVTIRSTQISTSAAKKYIQPYQQKDLPGQNIVISN